MKGWYQVWPCGIQGGPAAQRMLVGTQEASFPGLANPCSSCKDAKFKIFNRALNAGRRAVDDRMAFFSFFKQRSRGKKSFKKKRIPSTTSPLPTSVVSEGHLLWKWWSRLLDKGASLYLAAFVARDFVSYLGDREWNGDCWLPQVSVWREKIMH